MKSVRRDDSTKKQLTQDTPLLEGLLEHTARGYCGFHTPGHKQGEGAQPEWRSLLGDQVFRLDLTELPGLDNLHDPQGIIKKAQEKAAACFGAEETFFLVNGATAGVLAVLLAAAGPGKPVLLPRASHQSVFHGLILSGACPVYLPVRSHTGLGLPGMVTTSDLKAVLTDLPRGTLVVLLHPNYYGLAGEIRAQVQLAHEHGCPVLVDEAHGAHFITSTLFPTPALSTGADFVVQGAHKVLGAFTQAAFLHCQGGGDLPYRLRDVLRMVESSSPSYLLMASLDVARFQLQQESELWSDAVRQAEDLRRRIECIPGLQAPGDQLLDVPGVDAWDPTRLVVNVRGLGITGFAAADWLCRQRRLLVEMADFQNLVFILGPADTDLKLNDILLDGLESLAAVCGSGAERCSYPDPLELPLPPQVMTPREAFFAPCSRVPWEEAAGRVAAELVAPYPPGVPVVCPGERISRDVLEFLTEWQAAGGVWPGWSQHSIKVVIGS
jgi:arginine decarboxylase